MIRKGLFSITESRTHNPEQRSFLLGILPFYIVAHFAHHLLTSLPLPLLPFIRNEFALNYTQSTLVTSSFTLSYGFGQLPSGWLADRIGTRILILIGIVGVAIAGILVGFSSTYIMMLVFLSLMGFAGGGYHPAATPLISTSVGPEKRGRALGLHAMGGTGSYFLAPLIAAAIAANWGWRASFISLAFPTILFGFIFFVFLRRQIMMAKESGSGVAPTVREEALPRPGYWKRLIVFMALTVIGGGVGFSAWGVVPLFMVDYFNVSEQTAASLMSIVFSAGLWASPLGGHLSDRIGRVPIIIITSIFGGFCLYLLNVVPYGLNIGGLYIDGLGIGLLLFFMGTVSFLRMPVAESYIMGQVPVRHRSTVFGIYYFAIQQSGGVFAPILGSFLDRYGFYATFTAAATVVFIMSGIAAFFLWGSDD